jgi:Ser-tRNA(Ala) deacylase AlaX
MHGMIDKTELTYLSEPARSRIDVTVQSVDCGENGPTLILNRSPFYPQGGGQPSDIGVIEGDGYKFAVRKATLVDGVVHHAGIAVEGEPVPGPAQAAIESAPRALHARLHSAGHLIMTAMFELTGLRAIKGYHFPDGPYVEFDGVLDESTRVGVVEALQRRLNEMITADEEISTEFTTHGQLEAEGVFIPTEIPASKPTRVVTTFGYRSPCGGTHAPRSGDIAGLRVRKVKSKSGRTRVAYELDSAGGGQWPKPLQ